MKARKLPLLAACAVLGCAVPAYAASALGLTAEEMTKLYGADFARQTTDAQKLMNEEWDADQQEEEAEEKAAEPAPAPRAGNAATRSPRRR